MFGKKGLWRVVVGVGLILLGIAAILQTYNILTGSIWAIIFTVLFGLAGAGFLITFFQDRKQWWAIIPGFMLLGLASTIFLAEFTTGFLSDLAAVVFLASAALSFLIIYLLKRDFWWALIPAFVLGGLSVMIGLEESNLPIRDEYAVAVFLISIGLPFLLLYLIKRDFWWALIPAGTMVGVGLLVAFESVAVLFLAMAILIYPTPPILGQGTDRNCPFASVGGGST